MGSRNPFTVPEFRMLKLQHGEFRIFIEIILMKLLQVATFKMGPKNLSTVSDFRIFTEITVWNRFHLQCRNLGYLWSCSNEMGP